MKLKYCLVLFAVLVASCSSAPSANTVQTAIAQTQAGQSARQEQVSSPTVATTIPTATRTQLPTETSGPTNTPRPTITPKPTNTPLPPTPTPNPYLYKPGTYLVGVDIKPGIYRGDV